MRGSWLNMVDLTTFTSSPSLQALLRINSRKEPPKWYAAIGLQVSRDINLFNSLGGGAGAGRAGKGQISRPWP